MNQEVISGLDYLLKHFNEPYFPRRIQTHRTKGQVIASTKEETLRYFEDANYIDCRINAFSEHDIECITPNLIFVDLDQREALNEIRILFHKTIGGIPSILDTGNGYAILQPIEIESMETLLHKGKSGEEISKYFLKFAEKYLTNDKADPSNYPSLKSCLVRVPGTVNSKCNKKVSVEFQWNGIKSQVKTLPFKKYLQNIIEEENAVQKRDLAINPNNFLWIETLLKNRINDGRQRLLFDVSRYLINIKGLNIDEATEKINDWLNTRHYTKSMIKNQCKRALRDGKYPRRLSTIQNKEKELFEILTENEVLWQTK